MGLKRDLQRLREVGEERRQDLAEFIEEGEFRASTSEEIRVPVKIVDLPEFAYDPLDEGGVGMTGDADAQPDVGQPVDVPVDQAGDDGDGDEEGDGDEAGEGGGEHAYYEMDPEEFARELDDRLGLDLEPKGKTVVEETEGPLTDVSRQGPPGTLMMEDWFTEGLKRKLATDFDEDYLREALRVEGWDADRVFEWARAQNVPVSHAWIADAASEIDDDAAWESIDEMEANVERERPADRIRRKGIDSVPLRREDRRFRHPETEEVHEKNVVVVNIRDVSGSMGEAKRELVERVFTPMDWYLQGKYDHAEFVYVAHDAEAWEVDRDDFFGIQSGGGTRISAAYELVADRLDEEYPWAEWNRYVFAAGDGENRRTDTRDNVVPLMEAIDANLHAYVQVQPGSSARGTTHADRLLETFDGSDGVAVVHVDAPGEVTGAIEEILSTEDADE